MPINVPATQVEDFTSRMDGSRYSSFTPDTQLSSPMTGTVRFDYDVSRNCYLYIRVLNMDGEEVRLTLSGWTRQTTGQLRYRQTVRSSGSTTTVDIPEGYQLVSVHLGSTASRTATINHFSVTGFSEGLVDKVWYNEWIAEVYQGRDLIYTAYNVADTGFVWNPVHGAQYRAPELTEPLDIRVESNDSTTVRLDHVGRWEVSGTGTLSLTPEMSGRVLTFIGGSPSVYGLEEALPLYLVNLLRNPNPAEHGVTGSNRPLSWTTTSAMYDSHGFHVPGLGPEFSNKFYTNELGNETATIRVSIADVAYNTDRFRIIFGGGDASVNANTDLAVEVVEGSAIDFTLIDGARSASPTVLAPTYRLPRDAYPGLFPPYGSVFRGWSFEVGLNRWLTYPGRALVSVAAIRPDGSVAGVHNFTDVNAQGVTALTNMMSKGDWNLGVNLVRPQQMPTQRSVTIGTTRVSYSLPRHEYES